MTLSVHVEILDVTKKVIADVKTQASKNTSFSVDDLPNNATLASITERILPIIVAEGHTPVRIPFSLGVEVYLYGYPVPFTKATKFRDLTPLRSDEELHENLISAASRTDPAFQHLDLACVKKPVFVEAFSVEKGLA